MDIPIISHTIKPTVFISSQIRVFSEEREILQKMISEKFGFTVYLFEETSRPYPAREVYRAGVEQSHIFIGIYGTEYGWVDKDADMEISGLHDEWRIATKNNKVRLAFTRNTNEPIDPRLKALIDNEINADICSTVFDSKEQLYDKIIKALETYISDCIFARSDSHEKEIINYSDSLVERYNSKYIIETDFFRESFLPCVKRHPKIYLHGEPGQGKTVLLMLLAKKFDSIYISLRSRSSSYVLGHIINSVLRSFGKNICRYASVDDAFAKCEKLLRNYKGILVIDDVDQNPETARLLLGLEGGNSKIIFTGRAQIHDFDFTSIECCGFTFDEAMKYVSEVAPNADLDSRRDAIEKSKGNPQYLTYYCGATDKVAASSLDSYHKQIFDQLSVRSREILAVLSFLEVLLSVEEITKILSKYLNQKITGIALDKELSEIDFLVAHENNVVEVLHPAFYEYVNQKMVASGVALNIHKAISEIYDNPYELHFKVYHLVCAGEGESAYSDLPSAELNAYLSGYIRIARKLFTVDILMSRRKGDLFRLGYALYHTALLKKDQHGEYAGLRTIMLAEKIFKKAGQEEWVKTLQAMRATFLVESDRGYDAINMLQSLASHYQEKGLVHQEAVTRTNLGYVYQRLGLMDSLESETLRAKELHESVGDELGVAGCLLNINTVYIARGDYSQILKTCREIQELAIKLDNPRFEAGAQNGLTAYYRRKKKYDKAEEAARKSISIAKSLNAYNLVAINYGNLGNIFRDQGKISDAKRCHEKVFKIGQKMKSKPHIAHAKGRLAELYDDEGNGESAIQYGKETIGVWKEIGNVYELASESCKQAQRILKFAGFDWKESIILYQDAIKYYSSAGLTQDVFYSYRSLIDICLEHLDRFLAIEKLHEAITVFSTPERIGFLNAILEEISGWDGRTIKCLDANSILQELLKCISGQLSKSDLFDLVRNLTVVLKRINTSVVGCYLVLIQHLISVYHKEEYDHYITALAIVVEQIPISIKEKQLTCVFEELNKIGEEFSFRHEEWLGDQWFVFFDAYNVPALEARSGDAINERIATALVAILAFRQKKNIEAMICLLGWKRIGLKFQLFDETTCGQHDIPTPDFDKEWPVVIPEFVKDEYRDEGLTPVLISRDYVTTSDCGKYPKNRNMICLNLQLINEIVKHFTCNSCPEKKLRKFRISLMTEVFDVYHEPQK